jgi:hypothetical protein
MTVQVRAVDTVTQRGAPAVTKASFTVEAGKPGVDNGA